jgi:hypothetical protein
VALLKMILLINDFNYDSKSKHIGNVTFINVVSKVVKCKVFRSIGIVSPLLFFPNCFLIYHVFLSICKFRVRRHDIQQNDTEQNDTQQNDIQQNDIHQNDTQQNDIQQNDTQQNDTQHYKLDCDIKQKRQLNVIMLSVFLLLC